VRGSKRFKTISAAIDDAAKKAVRHIWTDENGEFLWTTSGPETTQGKAWQTREKDPLTHVGPLFLNDLIDDLRVDGD
jgi:hypothetical protein